MHMNDTVIVAARRTPIGAFQGLLAGASATQLGAAAARGAIADAGLTADAIDEVIFGCVLPAGLGQAPARQAALGAGIAPSVPATTVNKMCGSGMKALMLAADQVRNGDAAVALAGGLESMSNAPYLLLKARSGYRMGNGEIIDHMFHDGLTSPWDGQAMGCFAENTAEKYGFTRAMQDAYAAESVRRAQRAVRDGDFVAEIAPVTLRTRKGEQVVSQDETPFALDVEKIPALKPAFRKDGTVTAAASSSISDGAAAIVVASAAAAKSRGLQPIARIVSYASHAQAPEWFTTAPAPAVQKALDRAGWQAADVDLYEINEAFAVVTMACVKDLGLDMARVNVNGGACALGHPIGATGARLVTTLVHALMRRGLRRGVATQCIGGGEATAIAIEVL
jgi:acetyl-CoA C-acetyltransferase